MENNVNVNMGQQININMGDVKGDLIKPVDEFDISDSAYACVIFIIFSLFFSFGLGFSGLTWTTSSFLYFVLNIVNEGLFALASVFVAKTRNKNIVKSAGLDKKINGSIIGWCLLLAIVSLIGFGNLTNVFIEVLTLFGYDSSGGSVVIENFWQYLGWIISSCFVAAFCEELLFRGVIESGFRKWGIKVAVGCSALIFMIMHGSATQTIHQLIVGIIVGYIFYKTNNLWIGFCIHFFNNFIPITEVYLLSMLSSSETVVESAAVSETVTVVGLGTILVDFIVAMVFAVVGLYIVVAIIKQIKKENEQLNGKAEVETKDNLTSIKVDGNEQSVEVVINGETSKETKNEKPVVSGATIAMFIFSGIYLVFEWIVGTLSGFGLF